MEIKTNGDYNRIQINFSQDKTADGKIIKQSTMVNIREESVQKAYELYQELIRKIEGKEAGPRQEKEESKKSSENIKAPTCECGSPMILRSGKWGPFFSCSAYPSCKMTRPFKEKEVIPVGDQDLLSYA